MRQSAYSLLEIKSVDDEQRIIVGIASTPEADRSGDELDSKGAQFSLPMPFRWEHKYTIGEVFEARVTSAGIEIKARIPKILEAGDLQKAVDFCWQSIKYKLARGLSIGWKPIDAKRNAAGGLKVSKWLWAETSAVSIPMNAQATITLVKSLDAEHVAALGSVPGIPPNLPGVSGSQKRTAMNLSERITDLQTSIRTKSDRMAALMAIRDTDGLDWTPEQATEFDTLATESKGLNTDLGRYQALEQSQMSLARPVAQPNTPLEFRQRIEVKSAQVPKGLRIGRYALALFAADGDRSKAVQIAEKHWGGSTPEVALALKAAVDLGVTTSDPWGGELTPYRQMADEFVELLRAETALGRIAGFRRVPFNIQFPVQTAGTKASWVGEGGMKPVGKLTLDHDNLRHTKVAKIVAFSDEMSRFSNPGIEQMVRDDLIAGVAEVLDETFFDPTIVEISNIRPASVTNGAPNDAASGADADAVRTDLAAALASFASGNIRVNGLVIVTTPAIAANLALMVTALGVPVFPNMTPEGGSLLGYTVIVSGNVPDGLVVILKPSEIFLADDGQVTLDMSNQATLVMDDGASPSSTTTLNLWQQNARGIKAERFINWKRRRDEAVYYITSAVYDNA